MIPVFSAIILLTILSVELAGGSTSNDQELAKMFSPILVLTEETSTSYDDAEPIQVIKPEPVEIMGATSAENIWLALYDAKLRHKISALLNSGTFSPADLSSHFRRWYPDGRVNLSTNKFGYLDHSEYREYNATGPLIPGIYDALAFFDYPGETEIEWYNNYENGTHAGENFPNTAYVHIYERNIDEYTAEHGKVTVIQYFYFYPFNDWWNNHEGDWQRIDVVVSSRDPETAEFLGVEYRFHKLWLNYYKDHGDNPGITDAFVYNATTHTRLGAGTHPVAYIGAGSHAAYPIGGNIEFFDPAEVLGRVTGTEGEEVSGAALAATWEYMSHTGLVLTTISNGSHADLWETYNLVHLPVPDTTNADNLGLDPAMSWLGAKIRWGTPEVASPTGSILFAGNLSPKDGPYNRYSDSFGNLKMFDEVAYKFGDPFYHNDLVGTGSNTLDVIQYHPWAILGDETWSGTVALSGDVVVFPGAKLTIQAGTTVTFPSQSDRHKFKEGNNSLSEIFVYGTLKIEGTSTDQVVFRGPDSSDNAEQWGGIRMIAGSTEDISHTQIRNAPPPTVRPARVRAAAGDGQVILSWDEPSLSDPSISGWEYRGRVWAADLSDDAGWGSWTAVSGPSTREATVGNLAHGQMHQFELRAVNSTGSGPSSRRVKVALMTVSYSAGTYEAVEPNPEENIEGHPAQVTVRLSPAADRRVSIPITVTTSSAGSEDYTISGLGSGNLLDFVGGDNSKRFTIQADSDTDEDSGETLSLGFGSALPVGVRSGTPSTATVTLSESGTPGTIPPTLAAGLAASSPAAGQVRVVWNASTDATVSGYTLRFQTVQAAARDGDGNPVWAAWPVSWNLCPLPALGVDSTGFTHEDLQASRRYRYQVQATNAHGDSEWSASFPESGLNPVPGQATVRKVLVELSPGSSSGGSADEWEVAIILDCLDPPCDPFRGLDLDSLEDLTRAIGVEVERTSGGVPGFFGGASGASGGSPSVRVVGDTVRVSGLDATVVHQFRVRLVNSHGQAGAASDSVAVVPLRAQAGNAQVTLNWDNPGNETLEEWQYRQQRGRGSWEAWQDVPGSGASTSSHTVTGLVNGEEYRFQVRGVYEFEPGDSRAGAVSFSQEATPVGPPLAPDDLTAERTGDGEITLRWTAPASDGGSPVLRYKVRYYRADLSDRSQAKWKLVSGGASARRKRIGGLSNGTSYVFLVLAENEKGSGERAQVTATPVAPPEAPFDMQAEAGNQAVTLRWAAADNAAITGWQYRFRSTAPGSKFGDWQLIDDSDASTRSHTVEGLTNGERYVFRVRAVIGSVAGPQGPAVESTPNGLMAEAGSGSVVLTWVDPGTAGISEWEYQVKRVGPGSWGKWTRMAGSDASTRSHTVEDLTNGERYRFKVRGVSSAGQAVWTWPLVEASPETSPGVPPPPGEVPDAPKNLVASPGSGDPAAMVLSWEKGDDNGSALTGYRYRQTSDRGRTWSPWTTMAGSGAATTSHTVTGLARPGPGRTNYLGKNQQPQCEDYAILL